MELKSLREGKSDHIFLTIWNGGQLRGLTEKLWDFASLQRSVLCHIDSLEVIDDLIGSSNNLVNNIVVLS